MAHIPMGLNLLLSFLSLYFLVHRPSVGILHLHDIDARLRSIKLCAVYIIIGDADRLLSITVQLIYSVGSGRYVERRSCAILLVRHYLLHKTTVISLQSIMV